MRVRRVFVLWVALAASCLTAGAQHKPASQGTPHIIATARGVHNLSPQNAARDLPVHLRAVVTYYDPYIDTRHGAHLRA
jgi:hypothetical protein